MNNVYWITIDVPECWQCCSGCGSHISDSVALSHDGKSDPVANLEGYWAGYYGALAMIAIGFVLSVFFYQKQQQEERPVQQEEKQREDEHGKQGKEEHQSKDNEKKKKKETDEPLAAATDMLTSATASGEQKMEPIESDKNEKWRVYSYPEG